VAKVILFITMTTHITRAHLHILNPMVLVCIALETEMCLLDNSYMDNGIRLLSMV